MEYVCTNAKCCRLETYFNYVSILLHTDKDKLSKFFKKYKSMDYDEFLWSDYWRMIRELKLSYNKYVSADTENYRANYCELCRKKDIKKFHIHHTNYYVKGAELFNLNTLQVLCKYCHAKIHKKGRK